MAFDADEEILQDFLVEAGEILEQLSEQLVRLEREPDDLKLLNTIFRGFHTVKGGAGFLKLSALVEVCHLGENIFDKLRNQELRADAMIMDLVLQILDVVNVMFDEVRGGAVPTSADESFLEALRACADGRMHAAAAAEVEHAPVIVQAPVPSPAAIKEPIREPPKDTTKAVTNPVSPAVTSFAASSSEEITDDEFERLLDELHGTGNGPGKNDAAAVPPSVPPASPASSPANNNSDISEDEFDSLLNQLNASSSAKPVDNKAAGGSDTITDDEFESLLDQLHGSNKGPTSTGSSSAAVPAASVHVSSVAVSSSSSDTISDNEFEALLDQLHGKGKAPIGAAASASTGPTASAAPVRAAPAAVIRAEPRIERAEAKPEPRAEVKLDKPDPNAQQGDTTVRVDTKKLDDIMNMVGELVLVRNRLLVLAQASGSEDMTKAVQNLDVVTADLQTSVMQTRMQPIKKVFGRFPRVVRDLARSMKKEINLELVGEETDLDKNMVEALADPLVHLVRNAIDHGIEMPDERAAKGKDRVGKVVLSAAQEGDHILLSIRDDGRGMDPFVLKQKAVEKGLMDQEQADRLSETDAFNLIFMPGFSTKTEVSDISGRGVGMDVVKTRITQLNGALTIDSVVGRGSTIAIKLPLTLAILPTLMVMVNEQAFALPLASVNEIFHLDLTKTNVVDSQLTILVRGKALPLFYLDEWLLRSSYSSSRSGRRREGFVVLVQVGTQRVGFVVDALIGQQEVVIKPLGKSLQGTPGMAGATITSDGGIALILDIPALLKKYARRSA